MSCKTYWLFSFHSDNWKKLAISLQKLAIFYIYHIFAPFVKLHGSRFLYFFSLCDIKNEAVFLLLEHSSLRGVKEKKHEKKHGILAFQLLSQEIQLKNLTSRKISFEIKKIHAAKAYRNGAKLNYVYPLWFDQKSSTDSSTERKE